MYESELKHYGVKGMKWGVRRYGTVYAKTQNKFGENYSDRYKKKMSKTAIKMTKRKRKEADRAKILSEHFANKERNRSNITKQKMYTEQAKMYAKQSAKLTKRLSDIEAGKLKAGRDFIANYETTTNVLFNLLTPYAMVSRSVEVEYR